MGSVWRYWLSQMGWGCYWNLVTRSQGYCQATYSAHHSPQQQRIISPKMLIQCQGWETLGDTWWGQEWPIIRSQSWSHSGKPCGMTQVSYQKTYLWRVELSIKYYVRSQGSYQGQRFSRMSWKYEVSKLSYQTMILQTNRQCHSLVFFLLEGDRDMQMCPAVLHMTDIMHSDSGRRYQL